MPDDAKGTWAGAESWARMDAELESRGYVSLQKAADIMGLTLGSVRQMKHHGKIPVEAIYKHPRSQKIYIARAWVDTQVALPG